MWLWLLFVLPVLALVCVALSYAFAHWVDKVIQECFGE